MRSETTGCLFVITILCVWPLVFHAIVTWLRNGASHIDWETFRSQWRKK